MIFDFPLWITNLRILSHFIPLIQCPNIRRTWHSRHCSETYPPLILGSDYIFHWIFPDNAGYFSLYFIIVSVVLQGLSCWHALNIRENPLIHSSHTFPSMFVIRPVRPKFLIDVNRNKQPTNYKTICPFKHYGVSRWDSIELLEVNYSPMLGSLLICHVSDLSQCTTPHPLMPTVW